MADYKTPGVYIVENNAFPSSAVAVETAVPIFIGYTETAESNGKSILKQATRITSFTEYVSMFGGGFKAKFTIAAAPSPVIDPTAVIKLAGAASVMTVNKDNTLYMYNSVRLFFANGGGTCYILPVGTYQGQATMPVTKADFLAITPNSIFDTLKKESEPTLVVIPDVIALGADAYDVYQDVLKHCNEMQSRFGIFDLAKDDDKTQSAQDALVEGFRNGIGSSFLKYGAAYYPWLNSSVVQAEEVDFDNLDAAVDLTKVLPDTSNPDPAIQKKSADGITKVLGTYNASGKTGDDKKQLHQSLAALSPNYLVITAEIRRQLNEIPPSGAMAGIYTLTDNFRGVWKAPANVSLSMVTSPNIPVNDEIQDNLNVDAITGKSINVIRPFPGLGTMVWGGRTLDGNSQDWRYINVRRTMIMLQQSLKLATRSYVFEPNDANTWITVKSMFVNFLTNLWKLGALAGASPDQAFDVQIGLGATMTPNDILDGKMLISVKVAIVRPAEFIEITFTQQMQQS